MPMHSRNRVRAGATAAEVAAAAVGELEMRDVEPRRELLSRPGSDARTCQARRTWHPESWLCFSPKGKED